ncbi:MAG: zinc ribbon domain-containing protein [Eubacteriaceae bacterium]|nr:zinc ribbon domain-containing protein [Eubacteriaceae bacterium]
MDEWAKQADEYDAIWNSNTWNKALQVFAIAQQNHPFSAVRVREVLNWGKTDAYRNLKAAVDGTPVATNICPNCHRPVDTNWTFCQYCGHKLH